MSRPRIHLITLITKTAEFKKSEQKKRRINYHDMQVNIIYFEFNWIFAQKKFEWNEVCMQVAATEDVFF